MSFQRKCAVCGREFWNAHNANVSRLNLTCSPPCHRKQKSKRQRERRYRERMKRLARKHVKQATARKPKKGALLKWRPQQASIDAAWYKARKLKVPA